MTDVQIFDDTQCALGEGPLWHPLRQQLYWFDIVNHRLLSRRDGRTETWQFDRFVSAAGWVDRDVLLVATETDLRRFDLMSGDHEVVVPMEAEDPVTRSNDGRADPHGGFWIGTMGKAAEPGRGAIYRYYRGELRKLYSGITVSNSICFSPDGTTAYFTDTRTRQIMAQAVSETDGWPVGDPRVHIDLTAPGHNPDGSVVDAAGNLWSAQWGSSRVACYDPSGVEIAAWAVPALQPSCPAFGGAGLDKLYITTARESIDDEALAANPKNGMTFQIDGLGPGQAEHQIIL